MPRHHDVLSWYIRPLFVLPFAYFAYKRSLWSMTLTLLTLTTSMFWFPAPGEASPAVKEMLAAEREYLTANWTLWKVLTALVVPASFVALGLAFWRRSLVYGLMVIDASILVKIGWTFVFGSEAGAMSHLPAALLGLAVCDALILGALRGAWHLPTFFVPGVPRYGLPFSAFVLLTIAYSVLFTWGYLHTRGNVLIAILLHGAINLSQGFFLGGVDPRAPVLAAGRRVRHGALALVAAAGPNHSGKPRASTGAPVGAGLGAKEPSGRR